MYVHTRIWLRVYVYAHFVCLRVLNSFCKSGPLYFPEIFSQLLVTYLSKSKGYWNLSCVLNISKNIYTRLKRLRPFKAHSYQSRKQFITQISEHFISRCLSLKNISIFTWLEKKGVIIFTSCSEIVSKVLLRLMSIFRWCY